MGENTKIEWCHHTFNPWVGCERISPACDHCYAATWAKRTGQSELWQGERRRTSAANWRQPLKWNREAAAQGVRYRVFCASLADVFDNQINIHWRDDLWTLIATTPHLDWLLLTKRPQKIKHMLPHGWPWPNVWLGTTVENQEEADRRIPHLLQVPAKVRFLSCEPLLGPVRLPLPATAPPPAIHWVICGGESGGKARPMHPDWARSLRDQCQGAEVPFFFKQWGEYDPAYGPGERRVLVSRGGKVHDYELGMSQAGIEGWSGERGDWPHAMRRLGKKRAGRLLDGRAWDEVPATR